MGVVYRAFDTRLARPVAIKMLLEPGRPGARGRDRFLREARAAARLAHPGIVAVHEVAEDPDGRLYIVMDYIEGEPLERRHRRDPLAPRALAELVRQVAAALHHAHAHGVVHRDVKPANVMLDATGAARLCDFGLARELDAGDADASRLTATGQLVGTPGFMAPEQVRNGPVDARTDVFSLGGVLYWALTGHDPFEGDSILEVVRRVVVADPVAPRTIAPGVHPDLETIALRCLEKDPARRYPSAAEVADELARFARGEPIVARPLGAATLAVRWVRRHRLRATATLLVALGLIAAIVAGVAGRVRERARFVAGLHEHARSSADAFERERGALIEADAAIGNPAKRRDRLLALGLDALGDARSALTADPGDDAARRLAFELAMATGELALEAEQWSVATASFDRAVALDVDRDRAAAAQRHAIDARDRRAEERRAAVNALLDRVRSGEALAEEGWREAIVFRLVRTAGDETIDILVEELDAVTHALLAAAREAFLSAATPTAEERLGGERTIADLEAAVEAWASRGRELGVAHAAALEAAGRRLVAREMRSRVDTVQTIPLEVTDVIAAAQADAVGRIRLTLARLCCEALGWIGSPDRAVPALAGYLLIETDEIRATPAAVALARLGGRGRAGAMLLEARSRFGPLGTLWRTAARELPPGWTQAVALDDEGSAAWYAARGDLLREAGELEAAIAAYDRALQLAPDVAGVIVNRGIARRRSGDGAGARRDFERAIELAPGDPLAWVNRASDLMFEGHLDEAEADLERALAADPRCAPAWATAGAVHEVRRDYAGAVRAYGRAVEIEPRNVEWLGKRGVAKFRQRRPADALEDFDRALAIDPGHAVAWSGRARARSRLGDLEGAMADADRGIELDPASPESWVTRGQLRFPRGELDGAVADFGRAIELDPDCAGAYSHRGIALLARGEVDAAIADLDRAVELVPRSPLPLVNRSVARAHRGDTAGATADLDLALALDPDLAEAHGARGNLASDRGELDVALAAYDRAIACDPRYAIGWINRARLRSQLGHHAAAIADFDRAIDLDPSRTSSWIARALARAAMGDLRGALVDLDQTVERAAGDAGAWDARAKVRRDAGDLAGALEDYDRALELDPTDAVNWSNRAILRWARGEAAPALDDADRAIALDPALAAGWKARGLAKVISGDLVGALEGFVRATELAPDDPEAWANLARTRFALGDPGESEAAYDRALALSPDDSNCLFYRSRARAAAGNVAGAIADLERFLQLVPNGQGSAVARSELASLRAR